MLIPQDTVRREIIRVADEPGNPAIQLIEDIARYGASIQYDVIIEGILSKEKYGDMLKNLSSSFDQTYAFYFDLGFKETLRRHQTKLDKRHEFGEKEMKDWWLEKDILEIANESMLDESLSEDDVVKFILSKIK